MAYSSISLITLSAVARATVLSAGSSARALPESGTCLTRTTMFIVRTTSARDSDAGVPPAWLRSWRLLAGNGGALGNQGDPAHAGSVHRPVAANSRSLAA